MQKPIDTPPRGITWLEILVILVLGFILWSLSIPAIGYGLVKGKLVQTLSNMKQLQLATWQMTLDHEVDKDPVRWTCSNTTPLTLDQWKKVLSPGYLSDADLKKMFSVTFDRRFIGTKTIDQGFNVFAVTKDDPDSTVLFVTKNWHGPNDKELSGDPYGTKAFVAFRKGGAGMIMQAKQANNISLIGDGGMHNFLPLK